MKYTLARYIFIAQLKTYLASNQIFMLFVETGINQSEFICYPHCYTHPAERLSIHKRDMFKIRLCVFTFNFYIMFLFF